MEPAPYGTAPSQPQPQRRTASTGPQSAGASANASASAYTPQNPAGLSPYNPSPQGHTSTTSPHSVVGSSGPPSVNPVHSNPSPLVPAAYLTRYPIIQSDTYQLSPPQGHRYPASTEEMYSRQATSMGGDRFASHTHGQGHSQAWPSVPGNPSTNANGRDGIKSERAWSNNPAVPMAHPGLSQRDRTYSSSSFNQGEHNGNGKGNGDGHGAGSQHARQRSQSQSQNQGQNQNQSQSQSQSSTQPGVFPSAGPTAKRGSKACVACRRGKNRCEWDPSGSENSCRRCLLNGTACVFEKPAEKGARARNSSVAASESLGGAENRVTSLEKSVQTLTQSQDQIQSTLQQILAMLPGSQGQIPTPTSSLPPFPSHYQGAPAGVPPSSIFPTSVSPPSIFSAGPGDGSVRPQNGNRNNDQGYGQSDEMMIHAYTHTGTSRPRSPQNIASGRGERGYGSASKARPQSGDFPKLPGFAPPNHQFGTYGVIPLPSAPPSPSRSRNSSRSSSSHSATSSSALRQETLTAPIQALQALANAADQIAKTSPDQRMAEDASRGDERDADGSRRRYAPGQMDAEDDEDQDRRAGDRDGAEDEGERGRDRKRKRVGFDSKPVPFRVKKKKRPDPTPRNPFPDVVTKGLVSEEEARELWDVFFSGCHYYVPLFDKSYDTYEGFIERTPFSTNALLAIAAKIRAGNGPLGQTFQRCLEEAQGIARSTLFGPIVRKEAVIAMLLLSVWSQNGWLPCGHALRMGLDMNLHRALDRLANKDEERSEVEERDLVVSARIWLNCYMHEHLVSLGTGKPLLLRDDSSVQTARDLLSHRMASETDMRLIAGVELVNLRIRILDHLTPLHGKVDRQTISFVKRMLKDLEAWHREWYAIHRTKFDDESVLVKLLETELVYAQLWTVCVALRGSQWDKLAPDQRELAFQAKDAAFRCLEIFLRSDNFRKHLKYATHDQLVSVAFAAVFLLKIAMLYPSAVSLPLLISQVTELAHLLSAECFAERYALTLRLMLSNFRRKTGALSTVPGTPRMTVQTPRGQGGPGQTLPFTPGNNISAMSDLDGGLQSLLSLPTMDGLEGVVDGTGAFGQPTGEDGAQGLWDMGLGGFDWPTEFSPSSLPVWLQDGNFMDLGLPADGSDSLFLPLELANMFLPSGTQSNAVYQYALPDTGDVGAEAW
ncbi:hypothetical protein IAU60_002592 [Kwoniella sp. DSM 27419]